MTWGIKKRRERYYVYVDKYIGVFGTALAAKLAYEEAKYERHKRLGERRGKKNE